MMFDIVPPTIKKFEKLGYARCGYTKRRTGFKRVRKGEIMEITRVEKDEGDYYLWLKEKSGKFKVYFFKPVTEKEFEKYKLMEELG